MEKLTNKEIQNIIAGEADKIAKIFTDTSRPSIFDKLQMDYHNTNRQLFSELLEYRKIGLTPSEIEEIRADIKQQKCSKCKHSTEHKTVGNGITEPPYITKWACSIFDYNMNSDDYCSYFQLKEF